MNISIFGLGYVGTVSACCLAKYGHNIVGVDVNPYKVDSINKGESFIVEAGLSDLLREVVSNKKLMATTDANEAIMRTDISLICVGTPSNPNGSINLNYIFNVAEQIGRTIVKKNQFHAIVIRSTVMPGTVEKVAQIVENISGKKPGKDFGVASNPEFLREGCSISDFINPPFTLVGATDKIVVDKLRTMYEPINAPFYDIGIKEAEFIKYISNVFHAVKITFANEIGAVCKQHGIDSHKVMDVFVQDTKLNISPTYLKPGFAFGGSCLPKDVRAITYDAKTKDLKLPLLDSLMMSNEFQVERVVEWILNRKNKKIGILGLSFKGDTDDIRESPIVKVVESLLGKGFEVVIYDPNINLSKLIGANKQFIEKEIPHIARLMSNSIDHLMGTAEVILIANHNPEFKKVTSQLKSNQVVLDLVRITEETKNIIGDYEGICW